jgi:hypothetical protein
MKRKRTRMSPDEWADWSASREARIRQLRARVARIEAELAAERARPKKPGQADPDTT